MDVLRLNVQKPENGRVRKGDDSQVLLGFCHMCVVNPTAAIAIEKSDPSV